MTGPLFRFDNSYARLPDRFYARQAPTPVAAPSLIALNAPLAATLGLPAGALHAPAGVAILAGNTLPEGAEPIALAYAGHQFGNFVPQLGDGRAILLGELIGIDGLRRDLQLKGAGPTPFSRRGDGRAALGPVLREYIVSEAMAALGIPTTRALAAVLTGEAVYRDTVLPGAILTRVAASHLRIGTFEYFAARRDEAALRLLADYAIARHAPQAGTCLGLLEAVIARQATLVAQWMGVGFIHGVMNTDNTSISGETIDYGPCAFMDSFRFRQVFSAIDSAGRYAYGNQPRVAHWNLARLAEALLPLLDPDHDAAVAKAEAALAGFPPAFESAYLGVFRRKLGLTTPAAEDADLLHGLLTLMEAHEADFTVTFRALCEVAAHPDPAPDFVALFAGSAPATAWLARYRARLAQDPCAPADRAASMRAANPVYIPRNHLIEAAIEAAQDHQNYAPFEELHQVLSAPFASQPGFTAYAAPPLPHQAVLRTYCGT